MKTDLFLDGLHTQAPFDVTCIERFRNALDKLYSLILEILAKPKSVKRNDIEKRKKRQHFNAIGKTIKPPVGTFGVDAMELEHRAGRACI